MLLMKCCYLKSCKIMDVDKWKMTKVPHNGLEKYDMGNVRLTFKCLMYRDHSQALEKGG